MSVNLSFYGAVREIGGGKTVLRYDGTTILLDFGMVSLRVRTTSTTA